MLLYTLLKAINCVVCNSELKGFIASFIKLCPSHFLDTNTLLLMITEKFMCPYLSSLLVFCIQQDYLMLDLVMCIYHICFTSISPSYKGFKLFILFNFYYILFTMFCQLPLYRKVTQPYTYMHFLSHYPPSCSIISDWI